MATRALFHRDEKEEAAEKGEAWRRSGRVEDEEEEEEDFELSEKQGALASKVGASRRYL